MMHLPLINPIYVSVCSLM